MSKPKILIHCNLKYYNLMVELAKQKNISISALGKEILKEYFSIEVFPNWEKPLK